MGRKCVSTVLALIKVTQVHVLSAKLHMFFDIEIFSSNTHCWNRHGQPFTANYPIGVSF
jgi:hypothetical protein